jgi:hypothetical protein
LRLHAQHQPGNAQLAPHLDEAASTWIS